MVSSIALVIAVAAVGIVATGTWPFLVAVESGSMEPNLNKGDVVLLVSVGRTGGITTWIEGKEKDYVSFGNYGDVIVYRPDGKGKLIIHRAIAYVREGDLIPILVDGKLIYTGERARSSGYITQGDNIFTNPVPDQIAFKIDPVKEEWIVGVAKFRVPLVGYLRLIIPI